MSSYFVNSLFSKYKSGDSLRPNYYECGFAQDLAGSRPTVVYGPGSGATFQHAPQIQDFYHHSASSLPSNPYQQSPCAVTCHGEPGNFYGYDALQRQTLFGAQEADLVQYSDCKLGGATGLGGEDADGTDQSPSPTQLFPWMRPQGEKTTDCLVFQQRRRRGSRTAMGTLTGKGNVCGGHLCISLKLLGAHSFSGRRAFVKYAGENCLQVSAAGKPEKRQKKIMPTKTKQQKCERKG